MVRDTKRDTKVLEKCGFLAFIMMLFFGTIFGILGAVAAHFLLKYFEWYMIIAFAVLIAILLGLGTRFGAVIGRCCRLKLPAVLLILLLTVGCYSLFLFLNYYYDIQEEKPIIIPDELAWIAEEIQNFVGELPYASDYIKPVENSQRGNIGTRVEDFIKTFPEEYTKPVMISNIPAVASIKDYLAYPGITLWDEEKGELAFDDNIVKKWMLWAVECVFILLIALLITRGGTKKVYQKRLKRLERGEIPGKKAKIKVVKVKKEKKGLFGRKKKEKPVSTGLDIAPKAPPPEKDEPAQLEQKAEKKKKKKEKKGFSLFRRKKKAEAPTEEEGVQEVRAETETAVKPAETEPAAEFSEDQEEAQYALILHQYDTSRESDLVRLIQHVSQVPEEKAQRLLKVPSLLKRDVSTQEARIAIEKFNQVQAQVKLITMERLLEIQQKQQQHSAQPAPSVPQPSSLQGSSESPADERYALILRKFDPAQRKPVLELLSSLSGTPATQLQQTLKTPALILRDATKDEVTMIAQQFQSLQAEVKSLTMAELQKLMTKK